MLVLDASAFVALERGDRRIVALLHRQRLAGRPPVTHGGVVGQVWRGGRGRQVGLARLLPGIDVRPVDLALGRAAGELLARARTGDVVDAALVLLAADGDLILTSDVGDIAALAGYADLHVDVVPV